MPPVPKFKTYRNKKYLAWMRGQPCEACAKPGEPHHVRRSHWGAGVAQKPHDYVTISLCRPHHHAEIENHLFKGVERIIIDNLIRYIEENG